MHDAANRTLQIEAGPAAYYRSSVISLDGESAAPINEMTLSNLPRGEYDVIVAVIASDGHQTVDRRQFVGDLAGDDEVSRDYARRPPPRARGQTLEGSSGSTLPSAARKTSSLITSSSDSRSSPVTSGA